jgi:mannose-6-phosphate isomerase-like protein (cupin superfamily)
VSNGQVFTPEGLVKIAIIGVVFSLVSSYAAAQTPPPALDISAADVKAFIDKLPKDRVSDLPIRVTDVGGYRVGVYGVFRPKAMPGEANLHETTVTEIYYMLEGSGTLVTGGRLVDDRSAGVSPNTKRPNRRGSGIEGGVSRRVVAGDIIVIPGRLPHWWSGLDSDIRYLIYRPDPEGLQQVR